MTVFVTADHHFGHGGRDGKSGIIKYCDRPFKDANHMDTEMVNRWCAVVQPDDLVYVLGDFTLRSTHAALDYIQRLTGYITFLPGSHDYWLSDQITRCDGDVFARHQVAPPIKEIKFKGHYIALCHYAMRSWPRSFHGSLHLFGHSHGRLPKYGRSTDVGVDTNDFYPYRLDDVVQLLTKEDKHGD